MSRRPAKLAALFLCCCLLMAAGSPSTARGEAPAFTPKTGTEGKALMFAHLAKQLVVTRATPAADIAQIARIEGAEFIVDGKGEFPPKSVLERIADSGRPVTLILPLEFERGHLRRLAVLSDFTARFRITPETFTEEAAHRLSLLGPRRIVIEAQPEDLTPEVVSRLESIRRFDLRLVIPEESRVTPVLAATLKAKTFSGAREVVLPPDFQVADIPLVIGMAPKCVVLRVAGTGPNPALAEALNRHTGINTGAELRGLVKVNEAPNYLILQHLTTLVMHQEGWPVSDEWVRLMNRRG